MVTVTINSDSGAQENKPLQHSCLENPMNSMKIMKLREKRNQILNSPLNFGIIVMNMYLTLPKLQFLYQCSSVQFSSLSVVFDSLRPHEPQYTRPPCPSPTMPWGGCGGKMLESVWNSSKNEREYSVHVWLPVMYRESYRWAKGGQWGDSGWEGGWMQSGWMCGWTDE